MSWLLLIPTVVTICSVASSAYLSHSVVLPWKLGELGYIGAAALFAVPAITALITTVVTALWPRSISLGVLIYLPVPVLYLVLATGMGADLSWPSSQDHGIALFIPVIILLPLVGMPGLAYAVLREEFRERAGLLPKQPVLSN